MYVENKKLLEDMIAWKQRRETNPQAQMGNYTANAIMLIANNLVKRWNFSGYSYRDEMALDAIEVCVKYIHNFDPDRYSNPHAYITQACHRACVNRLKKESRQLRAKYAYYLHAIPDLEEYDEDGNAIQIDYSFYKDIGEKLKASPDKKQAIIEDQEPGGLSEFID